VKNMSRLLDTVKWHTKKIVVGTLILGSLIGIKSCRDNTGEVVFSGTIDGYEVTYEEGRLQPFFSEGKLKTGNIMVLKKDEKEHRFEDYYQESRLFRGSQKNPGYLIDTLDEITLKDTSGDARHYTLRMTYYSPRNYFDEQFVLDMKKREAEEFERCNNLYREIRGKIQEMLVKR